MSKRQALPASRDARTDLKETAHPGPGGEYVRHWVEQAVHEFQLLADLRPASWSDLYESLADVADRTPPPRNQMDTLCARYLLQTACMRMADRMLGKSFNCVDGSADWTSVWLALKLIASEPWLCLAMELRVLAARVRTIPPLPHRIQRYLRLHFTEPCHLPDVARRTGASLRVMTGAFRTQHRCTVHQYVSLLRLRAAIHLLIESDVKIAAICASVGWNSQADFYRHLRRYTACRPGAVRSDKSSASVVLRTLDEWLAAHGLPT